VELEI